jgi:hypothetical protein
VGKPELGGEGYHYYYNYAHKYVEKYYRRRDKADTGVIPVIPAAPRRDTIQEEFAVVETSEEVNAGD